jgi:hypothetical protein
MFEIILLVVVAVVAWFYMKSRNKSMTEQPKVNEPVAADSVAVKKDDKSVAESVKVTETSLMTLLYAQTANGIPQDSTLRRHYLQNAMANKTSDVVGVPEDSTLRRHFLQNESVQAGNAAAPVTEVMQDEVMAVDAVVESVESTVSSIPEDVVLKRHFIQQTIAEVEKAMPLRPTESTLKRHYDAQLLSMVIHKLQA